MTRMKLVITRALWKPLCNPSEGRGHGLPHRFQHSIKSWLGVAQVQFGALARYSVNT